MIAVEVFRIIIDEEKREQVVVLKERGGKRLLPIVIGMNEALAIRMHLGSFLPPRPLTHDLLFAVITNLGGRVEKIVIDELVGSTFHAKLYCKLNGNEVKVIDARPSDSIALAVRTKSDIFVEENVFNKLAQKT